MLNCWYLYKSEKDGDMSSVNCSILQKVEYMTFGIGLMTELGNFYWQRLIFVLLEKVISIPVVINIKLRTFFIAWKVSSRTCDWGNCLPWTYIDCGYTMEVCITHNSVAVYL